MKKKLTKAQMRVAVARDVIKRIRARSIKPTSGLYLNTSFHLDISRNDVSKQIIEQLPKKCEACAIGGMFLSSLRLYNKYKPNKYLLTGNANDTLGPVSTLISSVSMREDQLKKYFTDKQLGLIENVFETTHNINHQRINVFLEKHNKSSRAVLLIAIMKNIIKNKGTFKP
jgi:hypothetical protein